MIIQNNQVDPIQFNRLQGLMAICKSTDGSTPSLYDYLLIQKRAVPGNLLFFNNKHLVGFLSPYFFFQDACEVALLVDPAFRRQGIAKKLLQHIMPLFTEREIANVIFSSASHINDSWLPELDFQIHHTEYQMQRISQSPVSFPKERLKIQQIILNEISIEELSALSELDKACFPEYQENSPRHFQTLLNDPNYKIFIAFYEKKIIGKFHIRLNKKGATFSDLAIFPEYQNQGFGKELVAYSINYVVNLGIKKLILDVEPANQKAIKVYSHFNFKVNEERTFWTIPLEKLKELIAVK